MKSNGWSTHAIPAERHGSGDGTDGCLNGPITHSLEQSKAKQ